MANLLLIMNALTLETDWEMAGVCFFFVFSCLIILALVLEGETLAASMERYKIMGHVHQSRNEVP